MIEPTHADFLGGFFHSDFFHCLLTFVSVYFGSKHGTRNGNGK